MIYMNWKVGLILIIGWFPFLYILSNIINKLWE